MPRKKKIATKATTKPTTKTPLSKTKFILGQPKKMLAKDVVAKGKAAGMTFTGKYVWQVRSAAKKVAKKGKKTTAKAAPATKVAVRVGKGRKLGKLAEFVLAQDQNLSAPEVVALAKTAGFDLTTKRVHNIRWAAKKKGKATKAAVTAVPAAKAGKQLKAKPSKVAPPKATPAPTKAAKPGKAITKSAYVLGFPPGTSAGDIVAAGKAKGIKLTTGHVYAIRTANKAKAKVVDKVTKAAKAPAVKTAAQPAFRAAPRTGSLEEHFVALVLDIGLARASELLANLKDRVRQLAL